MTVFAINSNISCNYGSSSELRDTYLWLSSHDPAGTDPIRVEPTLDWITARRTFSWAWPVHVFGFAAGYVLLSCYAASITTHQLCVRYFRYFGSRPKDISKQSYVLMNCTLLVSNILLVISATSSAAYLFLDPYESSCPGSVFISAQSTRLIRVMTFPTLVGSCVFLQMDIMRLARVRGRCSAGGETQSFEYGGSSFIRTLPDLLEHPRFVIILYALNLVVVVLLIECLVANVAVVPRILLLISRSSAITWALVVCFLFVYRGVYIAHFADMAGKRLLRAGTNRRRQRHRKHHTNCTGEHHQQPSTLSESVNTGDAAQTTINMPPCPLVLSIPSVQTNIQFPSTRCAFLKSPEPDVECDALADGKNKLTLEDIYSNARIDLYAQKRSCKKSYSHFNIYSCAGSSCNNVIDAKRIDSDLSSFGNKIECRYMTSSTNTDSSSCGEDSMCYAPRTMTKTRRNKPRHFAKPSERRKIQASNSQINSNDRAGMGWMICGFRTSKNSGDVIGNNNKSSSNHPAWSESTSKLNAWCRTSAVHHSSTDETLVGGATSLFSISRDVSEQTICQINETKTVNKAPMAVIGCTREVCFPRDDVVFGGIREANPGYDITSVIPRDKSMDMSNNDIINREEMKNDVDQAPTALSINIRHLEANTYNNCCKECNSSGIKSRICDKILNTNSFKDVQSQIDDNDEHVRRKYEPEHYGLSDLKLIDLGLRDLEVGNMRLCEMGLFDVGFGDVGYIADNETVTPAVVRKGIAQTFSRLPARILGRRKNKSVSRGAKENEPVHECERYYTDEDISMIDDPKQSSSGRRNTPPNTDLKLGASTESKRAASQDPTTTTTTTAATTTTPGVYPQGPQISHRCSGMLSLRSLREGRCLGRVLRAVCVLTLTLFIACILQTYAVLGVYGVLSRRRFVEPWPWYIYQTLLRSVELTVGFSTAWISRRLRRPVATGSRRRENLKKDKPTTRTFSADHVTSTCAWTAFRDCVGLEQKTSNEARENNSFESNDSITSC